MNGAALIFILWQEKALQRGNCGRRMNARALTAILCLPAPPAPAVSFGVLPKDVRGNGVSFGDLPKDVEGSSVSFGVLPKDAGGRTSRGASDLRSRGELLYLGGITAEIEATEKNTETETEKEKRERDK